MPVLRLLLTIVVLGLASCAAAQTPASSPNEVYDYDAVETLPRLRDGRPLREAFVPDYGDRQRLCIEYTGSIYLTFVVTADGTVQDGRLLRGMEFCEAPLVASVEALGPWVPGEVDGERVATRMYVHYPQVLR